MNKEIPTFVEFLQNFSEDPDDDTVYKAAIAFTKQHVQAALQEAAYKADCYVDPHWSGEQEGTPMIDKNSILDAYPLDNIK